MDGEVTVKSTDPQWVTVKSGKSIFRLASLPVDDFPVWPSLESTEEMEMDSSLLLEMIDKTIYAAGGSDTRYVLNGLLFHIKPSGALVVVGTDGHRLALSERAIASTGNTQY